MLGKDEHTFTCTVSLLVFRRYERLKFKEFNAGLMRNKYTIRPHMHISVFCSSIANISETNRRKAKQSKVRKIVLNVVNHFKG